jgi:hypothetical protein
MPSSRCRSRPAALARGLGFGFGVGVAGDGVRHRFSVALVAVADLDGFQVERGEHQLHFAPDQGGIDLVGVGVQRHGGGLGHHAVFRPQERLGQIGAGGYVRGAPEPVPAGLPPIQRGLSGLGMGAAVVTVFPPRP